MLPDALPYHLSVRDHFRVQTSVWELFSAAPTREEQISTAERQARMQLYTHGNGELEITGRIVAAIMARDAAETSYLETARLFQLYTRIYGDRCAGEVMADPADPEYTLRIRALQLWREQGDTATKAISRIVEGPRELGRLDIFSQAALRELTREFIFRFLQPDWIRTPPVTALAYAYFADLSWDKSDAYASDEPGADTRGEDADRNFSDGGRARLAEELAGAHGSVRDYFAFVLLDFVLADTSLEERSAARARTFAADLTLAECFGHLYNRKSD